MTIANVIRFALLISIMLVVFGFGLKSRVRDATTLFRNPSLLVRSSLAMNVLLPFFAAALVGLFALRPAIAIALMALAVSPVPPVFPGKELKLGAHPDYVFGLFGASALLAIVLAPLTVALIGVGFSRQVSVAPLAIAKTVALTVLVPFSPLLLAKAPHGGLAAASRQVRWVSSPAWICRLLQPFELPAASLALSVDRASHRHCTPSTENSHARCESVTSQGDRWSQRERRAALSKKRTVAHASNASLRSL